MKWVWVLIGVFVITSSSLVVASRGDDFKNFMGNLSAALPSYGGNALFGNVTIIGNLTVSNFTTINETVVTGNITAPWFVGNVAAPGTSGVVGGRFIKGGTSVSAPTIYTTGLNNVTLTGGGTGLLVFNKYDGNKGYFEYFNNYFLFTNYTDTFLMIQNNSVCSGNTGVCYDVEVTNNTFSRVAWNQTNASYLVNTNAWTSQNSQANITALGANSINTSFINATKIAMNSDAWSYTSVINSQLCGSLPLDSPKAVTLHQINVSIPNTTSKQVGFYQCPAGKICIVKYLTLENTNYYSTQYYATPFLNVSNGYGGHWIQGMEAANGGTGQNVTINQTSIYMPSIRYYGSGIWYSLLEAGDIMGLMMDGTNPSPAVTIDADICTADNTSNLHVFRSNVTNKLTPLLIPPAGRDYRVVYPGSFVGVSSVNVFPFSTYSSGTVYLHSSYTLAPVTTTGKDLNWTMIWVNDSTYTTMADTDPTLISNITTPSASSRVWTGPLYVSNTLSTVKSGQQMWMNSTLYGYGTSPQQKIVEVAYWAIPAS